MIKINFTGIFISVLIIFFLIIKYFFNFKPKSIIPQKLFHKQKKYIYKTIFLIITICILILPLDIQILKGQKAIQNKITPIQILFDVSLSMSAKDIQPSRIEAGKLALKNLFQILDGHYISIITFSKIPFIRIPFSNDTKNVAQKMNKTKLGFFPPIQEFIGTSIGDALLLGIKNLDQFTKTESKNGIIILITDGDSHEGTDINTVIPLIQKKRIPVYIFGIGKEDFIIGIDKTNNTITTQIDISGLQKIAKQTGGEFFKITDKQSFIKKIQEITQNINKSEKTIIVNEYFQLNKIIFGILIFNLFLILGIQIISYKKSNSE